MWNGMRITACTRGLKESAQNKSGPIQLKPTMGRSLRFRCWAACTIGMSESPPEQRNSWTDQTWNNQKNSDEIRPQTD